MLNNTILMLVSVQTITTMSYPDGFSFYDYWNQSFSIAAIGIGIIVAFAVYNILSKCIKKAGKS